MSGDWIKWTKGLIWKPEVDVMARELGMTEHSVAAYLMTVWEWTDETCDELTIDEASRLWPGAESWVNQKEHRDVIRFGNAPSVTLAFLDRRTGVTLFGAAMQKAGWVFDYGSGLLFRNYHRNNSQTAKVRSLTQKRVQKHRNASVTLAPLPEKRREEKRRKESTPIPPQGEIAAAAECPFDSQSIPSRPSDLIGTDTDNLLNQLWGHGRVSSFLLDSVGGLVTQYGEDCVQRGLRICIKNGKAIFKYLETVCRNGANEDGPFVPTGSNSDIDKQVEAAMEGVRRAKEGHR